MTEPIFYESRKQGINWTYAIAASLYVLIMVGCAPTLKTVARATDQTQLARIAVEAKDVNVREAAVEKLTDQTQLARIAVEDKDGNVRVAAVKKLTDQALLAKMSVRDKNPYIRLAAVEKLTDQGLLAKIAVEDEEWAIRKAAMEKLTDQTLIAKIAMNDENVNVRLAALEKLVEAKLTDQALLAKMLAKIALEPKDIGKITNQVILRHWAEKDPQAAIRGAAVTRITDDSFLIHRLKIEPSAAVRSAIVKTLHAENSLREIATTAYHRQEREQALRLLKKVFKDPAVDVQRAHKSLARRVDSLAAEKDKSKLLSVALKGEFDVLRITAARHLSGPAALEQAALRSSDRDVLKVILAKLTDKATLDGIAATADDRAMRLAAANKSGKQSWKKIFDTATARGATVQMLGNALAAVSLFQDVQPDAKEGVQLAALNLIRLGNESRIPEMVDLLEGYGDKRLAEDYLNCGQPDLDDAGRDWARQRGFSVGTGSGSHRATWRSGR